jgi:hypothetical protein
MSILPGKTEAAYLSRYPFLWQPVNQVNPLTRVRLHAAKRLRIVQRNEFALAALRDIFRDGRLQIIRRQLLVKIVISRGLRANFLVSRLKA